MYSFSCTPNILCPISLFEKTFQVNPLFARPCSRNLVGTSRCSLGPPCHSHHSTSLALRCRHKRVMHKVSHIQGRRRKKEKSGQEKVFFNTSKLFLLACACVLHSFFANLIKKPSHAGDVASPNLIMIKTLLTLINMCSADSSCMFDAQRSTPRGSPPQKGTKEINPK